MLIAPPTPDEQIAALEHEVATLRAELAAEQERSSRAAGRAARLQRAIERAGMTLADAALAPVTE